MTVLDQYGVDGADRLHLAYPHGRVLPDDYDAAFTEGIGA